jgi:hypothetical protein
MVPWDAEHVEGAVAEVRWRRPVRHDTQPRLSGVKTHYRELTVRDLADLWPPVGKLFWVPTMHW